MAWRNGRLGLLTIVASFCTVLAACSVAWAFSKPDGSETSLRSVVVNARPFQAFSKAGHGVRFGRLQFRGGLVLTSPDPAFGGFSGLEISEDGTALFTVSDAGAWLKAQLDYNDERLIGVSKVQLGPVVGLSSKKLTRERDRDAEAVRLYKGTLNRGAVLIGFEVNQRIGFFDIINGELKAPRHYLRPPIRLSRNKGIEAVGVIKSGALKNAIVAFAEQSLDDNRHHRGWLWRQAKSGPKAGSDQPTVRSVAEPLFLTNLKDFDVTDVAGDGDGNIYVLERRFRWSEGVKMRIRRIGRADIKPGAVLSGEIMIEADFGFEIDNMEGLAIHRDKRQRTVLTLISDDNFNSFLQRNLILQFEVLEK